jgi:hypothetical protein
MPTSMIPGDPTSVPPPIREKSKEHIDLSASEKLITEIRKGTVKVPTKLTDLPRQNTFTSTMSLDVAASLGIPVGSTDTKYSRRIFIQEYLKYLDIKKAKQTVRWGIGVRWVVNYKMLDVQAKTTSIALIAASAQVGSIEAEARFQVIGIDSAEITAAIPAPVNLSVDTYVVLNDAFMKIKGLIWGSNTTVTPQILAVLGEIKDEVDQDFEEALAVSWALTKIAEGQTLQYALDDSRIRSLGFDSAVKAIFISIANSSEPNKKPSNSAQSRAREILVGFSLRR